MASSRWAQQQLLLLCVMLVAFSSLNFDGAQAEEVKTKVFRSPGFTLGPGDVIDRYLEVEMPKGHIAVRSLDMNVVSADGTVIPLSETYLHHWVLLKYHLDPKSTTPVTFMTTPAPNDGVCNPFLVQFFGLGSEFRKTNTTVPAPYGIVFGNPADVPEGLEEQWYVNVHAIDTRGVQDTKGCAECLCDVYNVSTDGFGRPLPPGYVGGIFCCHDLTYCPLKDGFEGASRELFLEFKVTYVDFSPAVIPVKVYLLDVTDQRNAWNQPAQCMVEYTVPKCADGAAECIHTQEANAFLPQGGYVVVSSAHMHSGGIVASISLENGNDICVSHPIYGQGNEAGNEKGYIVGMTSCYPDPKSIYIRAREKLSLRTVYDNTEIHTGVMGLLLLLIADGPLPPGSGFSTEMVLVSLTIFVAASFVVVTMYQNRNKRRTGGRYKPIV
ncbi:unnamed protein product [Calypogeia fissa]